MSPVNIEVRLDTSRLVQQLTSIEGLVATGRAMATQDGQCTRDPIYLVQKKERLYGFDTNYSAGSGDVVWLDDDGEEVGAEEHKALESAYDESLGEEPDRRTRTGYADRWEFVTCCFTDAAARAFIEANKHRHTGEMRVFVDTLYRNDEMMAVREHLLALAAAQPTANTPEPAPNAGGGLEVWPLVLAELDSYGQMPAWLRDDMRERHEMGVAKYGTALKVWNGRDAAVDAYQEALDLCVYLRQCVERVAVAEPDKLTRPGLGLAWSLDRALRLAHGLGELVREKAVPVEPPKWTPKGGGL